MLRYLFFTSTSGTMPLGFFLISRPGSYFYWRACTFCSLSCSLLISSLTFLTLAFLSTFSASLCWFASFEPLLNFMAFYNSRLLLTPGFSALEEEVLFKTLFAARRICLSTSIFCLLLGLEGEPVFLGLRLLLTRYNCFPFCSCSLCFNIFDRSILIFMVELTAWDLLTPSTSD